MTSSSTSSTTNGPEGMPGQRATRQRAAVLRALAASDDFRSAQEWHDAIRAQGDAVGLTTVYRTLAALAESGGVDTITDEGGEARYRRCSDTGHHHHLVCRKCGATVELEAGPVEAWTHSIAEAHGFTDLAHTVEIFGICPRCHA